MSGKQQFEYLEGACEALYISTLDVAALCTAIVVPWGAGSWECSTSRQQSERCCPMNACNPGPVSVRPCFSCRSRKQSMQA